MTYTLPVIAKALMAGVTAALGAAAVAAGGPDLSALDLGDILGSLGAGLVAFGATFSTPNKDTSTPVDKVIAGVEQAVAAHEAAKAEVDRVKEALGSVTSDVQRAADAVNLGPLASQILNGIAPAYSQVFDPDTQPWNR
ncbi:holin [Mycobacterium phage EagleEye]|uniref:Holin n=1 Tax=Mycobacterium phage EagleEye TaxID=1429759 RepID=W0LIS0_9CAUD|nr:holin [Mycobacterium phage EagleEye]AHG23793.1 holin [Mycobacterium phage EagleEye]QDK03448.1 holin [Mycobacterium phage Lucyedi]QNJ55806.1 holin [Mycobacterium phage PainterBoy]